MTESAQGIEQTAQHFLQKLACDLYFWWWRQLPEAFSSTRDLFATGTSAGFAAGLGLCGNIALVHWQELEETLVRTVLETQTHRTNCRSKSWLRLAFSCFILCGSKLRYVEVHVATTSS